MMKKITLFLIAGCLLFAGCSIDGDDNCITKTIASEQADMEEFANSQGMTWMQHSSGILLEVINGGVGPTPDVNSKVFIRYVGKLKNGNVFDSQTDHTQTGWVLGSLIHGLQIGLPLINEGGKIKLIIPSSLAYGCAFKGSIPSNSVLYFEIDLVDVQ